MQNANLILKVLLHHLELFSLNRLGSIILLNALTRKDLHANNDAFDTGRTCQRRIAHITSFLTEDRTQQFFFRCELRFTLRRHLTSQDIARFHISTDPDNAALIEIVQESFGDIRNITRDFLRSELRVTRLNLEFLDMNRCVIIVLNHPFGNENRILEVIATPGHERDQNISTKR